jgi:hypothetical protein
MSAATRYHWSPELQRFSRCIAEAHCPYGGAHTSESKIAESGGGSILRSGHATDQEISSLFEGAYSVGTGNRQEVYRADGTKLTRLERDHWQVKRAKAVDQASKEAEKQPVRQRPAGRYTSIKELQLAEKSTDPAVLAMLASSADPAVRLLVVQNSATTTGTLEQLALSGDKGSALYRLAAHTELGFRYQDERDAAELEACARMEADGRMPKLIEQAPAAALIPIMPQAVWARKPRNARRSLIRRAMTQLAKMLGAQIKVTGWTRSKYVQTLVGPTGMKLIELPNRLARDLGIRDVHRFIFDFFAALDPKRQKSLAKRIGFGW